MQGLLFAAGSVYFSVNAVYNKLLSPAGKRVLFMRTSEARIRWKAKRSLAGITLILLVFAGSLGADDNDKKPVKKSAAPAQPAPAAEKSTPPPTRTRDQAPPPRYGGSPGATPGSTRPSNTTGNPSRDTPPATRPGGYGTSPAGRPGPANTAPGVAPGTPRTTEPAGRYGTPGTVPVRPPYTAGGASRTLPVGGREYGSGKPVPGSVRSAEFHGDHAVYRGPSGRTAYERKLPDGRRIYADGRGRGVIERQYVYRGQPVSQRVYYVNGVASPRYYNSYRYGGVSLTIYAPARYYPPAFYGWAYNPWAVPVVYSFGFAATPWYGYYRGYFTPYPVYASPSLWLTDYMVANSLEQSYQAQAQMQSQQPMQQAYSSPLTPDIKQQISEEVTRQIQLESSERQAAQTGLPNPEASSVAQMLQDNTSHVFVVSAPLNLSSAAGQCPVTEGDVLQMGPPQTPNAEFANVIVLASKGQDCPRGSMVPVGVADLQEMQNSMRQTIDQGLATLQQNQGQGGIPPLPAGASAAPTPAAYAQAAPPVDPNGAQQIAQEWTAGNAAAQAPVADAAGGQDNLPQPAPIPQTAEPAQIGLGMSIDEVVASQGKPNAILTPSNTKKIYVYPNFKVTFTNGQVTDMQ
jgi:hypothetical protein